MQTIKFTPELLDAIRKGSKRATTRLGRRSYYFGEVALVSDKDPSDGVIGNIHTVTYQPFRELEEDSLLAFSEGYRNGAELQQVLMNIYGDIDPDTEMTSVYFVIQDQKEEI
jgi:hypothetical protein